MQIISSRTNPTVRRYRALAAGRGDRTALLVEGARLLTEAQAAGLAILHAAVSASALTDPFTRDAVDALERCGTPVARVTRPVLDAISPARSPSGLTAIAARPPTDLGRALGGPPPQLVVALVDVQDPGNVGAALRAADAGGATGTVLTGACADPFGWKALRGAMGSAFRLPLAIVPEAGDLVRAARARGFRVLAALPRGGGPIDEIDVAAATLVLLGGEGAGLDPALAGAADAAVSVPMRPGVESLNVAVSAALIVYDVARARSRAGVTRE